MGLRTEKYWPFAASAIVGALAYRFELRLPVDEKEFLAAAISLGAVLTGFVATAQAILMALPNDTVMGRIRASGYLEELTQYISHALNGTLLFSIVSLIGFFLRVDPDRLPSYYGVIWVVSCTFALTAFYRVTSTLMAIMRH